MAFKMNGDVRLDMGPGEVKRICAKSVKPAARVGVAVGISGCETGGAGVSVGMGAAVGVSAAAVAKAACPVNATTVGR
jgi:hypothetical protein